MYERHRKAMVQTCVIEQGIDDPRIVAAMSKIERHRFVESAMTHQAYMAKSLPIGFGVTISHPGTVAAMTHLLELKGDERVLEIGTGSGYQACVLAEIGVKVYTIERIPEMARRAQKLFDEFGYYTIGMRIGDGSVGWSNHAPYDRIIVTAASPEIPGALRSQLAENGRLLIPVGSMNEQKLTMITRKDGEYHKIEGSSQRFVPLIGKKGWEL